MRNQSVIYATAILVAVVFLSLLAGGCSSSAGYKNAVWLERDPDVGEEAPRRRGRRGRYSRIPGNYPAGWQTATGGY